MSADYIIIGAGTSGLLVANRLSADPNTQVVLIEPGRDDRDNTNVTDPFNRNKNAKTPIDWCYQSTPQRELNDRNLDFTAGKIVGGTSMINGLMYIRPAAPEIDGWERLGAKGWNWNTLWPFYKGVERFFDPTPGQVEAGVGFVAEYHGRSGEVAVGYPSQLLTGDFLTDLATTWDILGVPNCEDANGGKLEGFTIRPMMVDKESGLRASAATAFYHPISDRPNLRFIRGTALKLLWNEHAQEEKEKAAGVRYLVEDGGTHDIMLGQSGEVILAAGALATPGILEASGIGSTSFLTKLGIEVRVELPGVGENLQDQPDLTFSYSPKAETPGAFTPYAAFVTAKDVFKDQVEIIASATKAKLRIWADSIASATDHVSTEAIESILRHQHDLIFKDKVAIGEITMASSKTVASEFWLLLPFSRGSVHLRAKRENGAHTVNINPRFFSIDFDETSFIALSQLTQTFWSTDPAAKHVVNRVEPSDDQIPSNATDKQWKSYVKSTTVANHHVLGTAALMSRELGGVVDDELMVYDTKNVRVVDASVIPLQVTGHLVSTIYAIAERAAELILETRTTLQGSEK